MATLLRLADTDLRDAAVLEAGRDPGNAPALAGQAVTRLIDAVAATEVGWTPDQNGGSLAAIPDLNLVKRPLVTLRERLPPASPPTPGKDGAAPPPPDGGSLREGILSARTLLKELAVRFGTVLSGTGPAGSIAPLRPERSPEPPKQPKPTAAERAVRSSGRTMRAPAVPPARASTVGAPTAKMAAAARKATPTKGVPSPRIVEARPLAPAREVEGRSAIASRAPVGGVTSKSFWSLMDRWRVPDADALRLIGHAGALTKKGTRPRFKLIDTEVGAFLGFKEVDDALVLQALEPSEWLHESLKEEPFDGATPLEYLVKTRSVGIRDLIRFILQHGLKMSVSE